MTLKNTRILITAGPTQEAIDPVRYISNHSSGRMGFEIARRAVELGATVDLVHGPVEIEVPNGLNAHAVVSAEQMYQKSASIYPLVDIVILVAAVSDYTPIQVADQKIKSSSDKMVIELTKTKDIAAELGKIKQPNQINIGFALETNNEVEHALKKLHTKQLDFIVLNSMRDKNATFGGHQNKVTILDKNGNKTSYPLKSKTQVAVDILDYLNTNILCAKQ